MEELELASQIVREKLPGSIDQEDALIHHSDYEDHRLIQSASVSRGAGHDILKAPCRVSIMNIQLTS